MSEQKKAKIKIENAINELLTGEINKNALNFVGYLRTSKTKISQVHANRWDVSMGKKICKITVNNDDFAVIFDEIFNSDYDYLFDTKELKDNALKNIKTKYCCKCQKTCVDKNAWIDLTILGTVHKEACKHLWIYMELPDETAVECAKKIIGKRLEDISKK